MATDKVRFGVIGTGGMGSGHCTSIPNIPDCTLTAVCDTDLKTRTAIAEKCNVPAFDNHTALLDSGLVDAVIIATPHYFHPPIAIEAFQKGIHVLSEKPLGVTVGSADAMLKAAKESGKKFGIMYQMRGERQNQAARAIIESGRIGKIYRTSLIMGWFRTQAYYNSGGWRATWDGEGGGVLINQSPHALDLFSWLGGLPSRITAQTRTSLHDIEVEDEAVALLEYPNGAHGYIYASTVETPQIQRIEICGDKGKILLDGSDITLFELDNSIRQFSEETEKVWAAPKPVEVPVELSPTSEAHGHAIITQNFARAILYNEPLIAPGEEGLNALELINGMILSSKTEKPVTVPVARAEYEALIQDLRASSRHKKTVKEVRETDPNHV